MAPEFATKNTEDTKQPDPVFLTSRLSLDLLRIEDATGLFEVRGDPQVMAFWDWPADPDVDVTRTLVGTMIEDAAAGRAIYWTMRLRADGSIVGIIDLSDLRPGESADIGFMIARRYWGQGFAREAVMAVLEHARAIGIRHVSARVHDDNDRSVRLLEAAGFVTVDVLPDYEIRPGFFGACRSLRKTL